MHLSCPPTANDSCSLEEVPWAEKLYRVRSTDGFVAHFCELRIRFVLPSRLIETRSHTHQVLIVGYDKKERYNRYDIFLKKRDEAPAQVTNFGFYSLDPISVSNARILFSALNGPYDIYSLRIDQLRVGGITPQKASKLPLPDKAIIVDVAVSRDDQHMSFLQAETVKGQGNFQYNLHLANIEAVSLKTIRVEGTAMSRGVFDQDSLIYNELFEDHYRISKLNLSSNTIEEIAVIRHSRPDIKSLERIKLSIE